MPKKTDKQDMVLELISQAITVRQELTDRVVAMTIESTPRVANDEAVKRCLNSLRLIQATLQKIAEKEGKKIRVLGEKDGETS